jgi:hypothetical protein
MAPRGGADMATILCSPPQHRNARGRSAWPDVGERASRRQPHSIGTSGRVKTTASVRDLPIGATLAAMLVQHAKAVPSHSTAPVFPQPAFRYAVARTVSRAACKAAEIEGIRIHDLRHTYAVHAIKARVPISRLQRLLGHASPIITLRYATHAREAYFSRRRGTSGCRTERATGFARSGVNSGSETRVMLALVRNSESIAELPTFCLRSRVAKASDTPLSFTRC